MKFSFQPGISGQIVRPPPHLGIQNKNSPCYGAQEEFAIDALYVQG